MTRLAFRVSSRPRRERKAVKPSPWEGEVISREWRSVGVRCGGGGETIDIDHVGTRTDTRQKEIPRAEEDEREAGERSREITET